MSEHKWVNQPGDVVRICVTCGRTERFHLRGSPAPTMDSASYDSNQMFPSGWYGNAPDTRQHKGR